MMEKLASHKWVHTDSNQYGCQEGVRKRICVTCGVSSYHGGALTRWMMIHNNESAKFNCQEFQVLQVQES